MCRAIWFWSRDPQPASVFFRELLRGRAVYDAELGGRNLACFSSVAEVSFPDSLDGAPAVREVAGRHAN
eukprot:8324883-Pyramimonas_sp.AAC.1